MAGRPKKFSEEEFDLEMVEDLQLCDSYEGMLPNLLFQ